MKRLLEDEQGLTTVEYLMLLALIATFSIPAWMSLNGTTQDLIVDRGAVVSNLDR